MIDKSEMTFEEKKLMDEAYQIAADVMRNKTKESLVSLIEQYMAPSKIDPATNEALRGVMGDMMASTLLKMIVDINPDPRAQKLKEHF